MSEIHTWLEELGPYSQIQPPLSATTTSIISSLSLAFFPPFLRVILDRITLCSCNSQEEYPDVLISSNQILGYYQYTWLGLSSMMSCRPFPVPEQGFLHLKSWSKLCASVHMDACEHSPGIQLLVFALQHCIPITYVPSPVHQKLTEMAIGQLFPAGRFVIKSSGEVVLLAPADSPVPCSLYLICWTVNIMQGAVQILGDGL